MFFLALDRLKLSFSDQKQKSLRDQKLMWLMFAKSSYSICKFKGTLMQI